MLVGTYSREGAPAHDVAEGAEEVRQERHGVRFAVRLDGSHDVAWQPVERLRESSGQGNGSGVVGGT